jgi:hypothetical protein
MCPPNTSLVRLVIFPNATRIKSQQFILLKRGGLFNAFPNLGRKVIKSATKEEICVLICPS